MAKKPTKKSNVVVNPRDSKSGQFRTRQYVKENPDTTTTERNPRKKKK